MSNIYFTIRATLIQTTPTSHIRHSKCTNFGDFSPPYFPSRTGSLPQDRNNIPFKGTTRIMWTVDHIKVVSGSAVTGSKDTVYFAFTKIGHYVQNPPEEIFVLTSSNLLSEADPADVTWDLLPHGDHGVRAPACYNPNTTVMEEGHVIPLRGVDEGKGRGRGRGRGRDGDKDNDPDKDAAKAGHGFYIMGRTDKGYLAATSCDAEMICAPTTFARYWNNTLSGVSIDSDDRHQHHQHQQPQPQHQQMFAPQQGARNGDLVPMSTIHGGSAAAPTVFVSGIKNTRGPFSPKWIAGYQMYLLLFYNNRGGGDALTGDRNPYWVSSGFEAVNGEILWSQPEVSSPWKYSRICQNGFD